MITKGFVGDFEPTKLDDIFGRTTADINNLIEEGTPYPLLDLEKLYATLKDCVHIEDQEIAFNQPANWNDMVLVIKSLVAFLNEQLDTGKLYLVGKYEIEFFEMLAKL